MLKKLLLLVCLCVSLFSIAQQKLWVEYKGREGAGKGKHIVLVSGDEEYRSEEALPMLAQILSQKHGFDCTVLFAIDPSTGEIDANNPSNIPGLEHLAKADLMFIFTRFRELPDAQMKYIDQYIQSGKPVVALRTATHAFMYKKNPKSIYAKYDFQSKVKGWENGFGKKILGETWIDHHGKHGSEGTRALIDGIQQNKHHSILNGVKDIWGPTDVYTIKQLPADAQVLLYGQSTSGMTASSPVNLNKSIMPVAWTRTYTSDSGKKGKVFATTMGAAIDLMNEDLRRLLVNACYWATGIGNKTPEKADVNYITEYKPAMFNMEGFKKGAFPSTYELKY
jgi:type 1 glutamine amidotransferase